MTAQEQHHHEALSAEDLGDVMSRSARQLQTEHGDVEATL